MGASTSHDHLTTLPPRFIIVRILQVLFTIATLPLSTLIYSQSGDWPPLVLIITASLTLPVLAWIILSTYRYPQAYNYWALLCIEVLFAGLWASGFVWALGSGFNPADRGCRIIWDERTQTGEDYCPVITNEALWQAAGRSGHPLQGFAGSLMVLWLTSLIVVSVFIARHRKGGGGSK